MGALRSPLSCKFKCGRDVSANLNVRRRTDGLRHAQHGQGEAGQWEGGRATIKTNGQSLWTTYGKRLARDGGDPEDTNGRRASRGPDLGERERERDVSYPRKTGEQRSASFVADVEYAQFIFIRHYFQSDLKMQWLCEFAVMNPDIHLRLSRVFFGLQFVLLTLWIGFCGCIYLIWAKKQNNSNK